jgi:hypothetical protein
MQHGQDFGERSEEICASADSIVKHGVQLTKIIGQTYFDGIASVTFESTTQILRAELNYTKDSGAWKDRHWEARTAELDTARHKASAALPKATTVFFFNLLDANDLPVSSEHMERS